MISPAAGKRALAGSTLQNQGRAALERSFKHPKEEMMHRKPTLLLLAFAAVLLLVPAAFAQPPGGGPGNGSGGPGGGPGAGPAAGPLHNLPALIDYLELTDQQVSDLQTILQSHRDTMEALVQQEQDILDQLKALFDAGDPDAAAVGDLVIQLHAVRDQLAAERQALIDDIMGILDATQQEKLQQLLDIWQRFFGPRGPAANGGGRGGNGNGPGGQS